MDSERKNENKTKAHEAPDKNSPHLSRLLSLFGSMHKKFYSRPLSIASPFVRLSGKMVDITREAILAQPFTAVVIEWCYSRPNPVYGGSRSVGLSHLSHRRFAEQHITHRLG